MLRRYTALAAPLLVSLLAACPGDDGGGGGNGDPTTYTLSGTITAAAAQAVDADTGDTNATAGNNDDAAHAQALPSTVTLGGWVHATSDEYDFFSASLAEGQTVTMIPGDGAPADVDLCMAMGSDPNFSDPACVNADAGIAEQIGISGGGDFYIRVRGFSASSTYTLVLGQGGASAHAVRLGTPFVPGEALVRFRDGAVSARAGAAGPTALAAKVRSLGLVALGGLGGGPVLVGLPDDASARAQALSRLGAKPHDRLLAAATPEARRRQETRDLVTALRARADVVSADPNYVFQPSVVPNDAFYDYQWHYPLIQLPQAWEITTGLAPAAAVTVAVIDTGIVPGHPDLADKLVAGYDFITSPTISNDGGGRDNNPADPGDATGGSPSSFHGTHVAGTIGAEANDAVAGGYNGGVAGVSWGAKILPVRVLGKGGGTSADIIAGVRWAAGLPVDAFGEVNPRASILNLSLGCLNCFSQTEANEYAAARAKGVIVIAAAGNEDSTLNGYPASYPGVVSVAAVDSLRQKAPYSNHNAAVDIAAPGGDTSVDRDGNGYVDGVLSTLAEQDATTPNWTFYQGTSMASPHMAGVVALMKSVCTTLDPDQLDALIDGGDITDDLGAAGKDPNFGWGLVNALEAVQQAQVTCGSTPTEAGIGVDPTTVDFGAGAAGTSTNRTVTVSKLGSGTLANVTASESVPWLTVSSVAAPGLGAYTLTASRGSLPDGVYSGSVTFTAGAKSVSVAVNMRVGSAAPTTGDVGFIYLLVVDPTKPPATQVVGGAAGRGASGAYGFSIPDIAAGEYVLVAGTDADNDNFICDEGEACGAWPTLGAPTLLPVEGDAGGLDFTVSFDVGLGLSAAGGRPEGGYRIPDGALQRIGGAR